MTNTSMPKQNYPCPNCKYFCEDTKCCITCDNCMNSYHLKCTHLNNKVLNLIKKKNTKFICKICNDKHNCDKCDRQLNSHPKGIYCVNCLEYSCLGCLSMTNDEVHKFLTTKQPYYCSACYAKFYCPECNALCEDHEGAEPSIFCNICTNWMHFKCSKLQIKQFNKLGRCSDPYFCKNCIQKNLPFTNTNTATNKIFRNEILDKNNQKSKYDQVTCNLCIECNMECEMCSSCPDLFRVCDNCSRCKMVDMCSFTDLSSNSCNDEFFATHFNMRSLKKNIDLIKEFLLPLDKPPDIICVTETKLNDSNLDDKQRDSYLDDVQLDGYLFFEIQSTSRNLCV